MRHAIQYDFYPHSKLGISKSKRETEHDQEFESCVLYAALTDELSSPNFETSEHLTWKQKSGEQIRNADEHVHRKFNIFPEFEISLTPY